MKRIDAIYSQLKDQFANGFEFGPAKRPIQRLDQNSAGEITVVFKDLLILVEEVGERIIVKLPGGVRSTNNELPDDLGELCDQFMGLVKAAAGSVPVDEILV